MFNTRVHKEGVRIDAYATDLKQKASSCEFENLQDSLIRDRVVCRIKSDAVRKRFFREDLHYKRPLIFVVLMKQVNRKLKSNIVDEKAVNHAVAQGEHGGG